MTKRMRVVLLAALAAGGVGCAQDVGDIDETQPDKIDVSIFSDGNPWWFLQTVVDVPPTTQFTFVGESSFPPDRIVWDVQENWLIAYRNYEYIAGAQTVPYTQTLQGSNGLAGTSVNGTTPVDQQDIVGSSKSPYFGEPVAAYAILSHFDVQRGYNPATGEQTNVITENTTDRPWYERQYIRVDWSNNGFGAFDFMGYGMFGQGFDPASTIVSPVAYYPDQGDPTTDAPEITPGYIGIVNKLSYTAEVDTAASAYYGVTINKCYDFTAMLNPSESDCGPGEVKVRLSFKKIPANHDFAPKVFNDQDEALFGVWQQERSVWDPQRGLQEANLAANQFAVMHHIWNKDHFQVDPNDGKTPCDPNNIDSAPECVMPLYDRVPKPIVYYSNDAWPDYNDVAHHPMWIHAELLAKDYDDDMRGVVAAARRGGPSLKADASGCSPTVLAQDAKGLSAALAGGQSYTPACAAVCSTDDVKNEVGSQGKSGSCPYLTVADWMTASGIPAPDATKIVYKTDGTVDYSGTKGLDYLEYPPDTRYLDPTHFGYEGVRANETYVKADGTICTSADITAGSCSVCDPTKQYCMGIGHVPVYVVPRMFLMCHNPVQPRVVKDSNGNVLVDKSDPLNPASYDFSTLGDPDGCDPRPDAQRTSSPLQPVMGDLRYHMLSWVQQPDIESPGGIGEPAMDPVTGEIISSHAYIYARAVENLASYGADLVAIMEGWEPVSALIQGNITQDYIQSQTGGYATPGNPGFNGPPMFEPAFAADKMSRLFARPGETPTAADRRIQQLVDQVESHRRDPGGNDWTVQNWQRVMSMPAPSDPVNHLQGGSNLQMPLSDQVYKGYLAQYGGQGGSEYGGQSGGVSFANVPQAVAQSVSFGQMLAPPPVSTWDQQYRQALQVMDDRHALVDDEIEPTAVRLANYYDQKFYTKDPVTGARTPSSANTCTSLWTTPGSQSAASNAIGSQSPQYRTCVWELARAEILGNLWRSYSNHEVGHTFGQFHNFAGSTDALNYFDPYWSIRQENTIALDKSTPTPGQPLTSGQFLYQELGDVPVSANPNDPNAGKEDVLAPEWMQAPSEQTLAEGLREYQYTSIMDYNAKFNSDFQGIGKYDHACHMFQYANQVEVFDPVQLPNVPANQGQQGNGCMLGSQQCSETPFTHTVDDTLLVPFNRHYTFYPWLINDGLSSEDPGGKKTPLAQGIQKMIHARRWVDYQDLTGQAGSIDEATAEARDGMAASELSGALMVPYRFCSDLYNLGEAHCLWFDEGADAFEQVNGFVQLYHLNYLFNNFKRGQENFDVYDNMISYQGHLWERNFDVLVTIFQQAFNDEFVARYTNAQMDGTEPKFLCPEGKNGRKNPMLHIQGVQCGLDRMAAMVDTVDFFTKILQTPTTDTYLLDSSFVPAGTTDPSLFGVYCPSSYGLCGQDGYTPDSRQIASVTLLPGRGSKYDLSQFDLNEYGQQFLWKPTVIGVWIDKMMAVQAMTDPDSNIVGQLNSQPLSFLLSMNDLFFSDIEGAVGGLLMDDPNWAPKVAIWHANPQDPNHPPVTIYRNSKALQGLVQQTPPPQGLGTPYNEWCPQGSSLCIPNDPSSAEFELDPAVLQKQGYDIRTLDPGPVYFEKLYAAYLGAIWMTAPFDDQRFIQSIRIGVKGNTFEAIQIQQMSCSDGKPPAAGPTTCADGSGCSPGNSCEDQSVCAPRSFTCSDGTDARASGICIDASNPTATTCDPDRYAEVSDPQNGTTYYAVRYVPSSPDLTVVNAGTTSYYSTGYQLVRLAALQKATGISVGAGAGQFLDILRGIYYYWNFDPYANGGDYIGAAPFGGG